MMKNTGAFKELGKAPINSDRDMVISEVAGGYTIAQVAYIIDDERADGKMPVFLKNSMKMDAEKLVGIYDMIGRVLEKEGLLTFDESAE